MASYTLKKPETFAVVEPLNQLITEGVPSIIVSATEEVSPLSFLWSISVSLVLCFDQLINFHIASGVTERELGDFTNIWFLTY